MGEVAAGLAAYLDITLKSQSDIESGVALEDELVSCVISALQDEAFASALLRAIEAQSLPEDELLDAIWLIDVSTVAMDQSTTQPKAAIRDLVKRLLGAEVITAGRCQEILRLELIEAAGLSTADTMKRKLVRENTKRLYTQEKFNLLREEAEGYAKLLTALLESRGESQEKLATMLERLIGYFRLDPNRVVDLVISVAVSHAAHLQPMAQVLTMFKRATIAQILGRRLALSGAGPVDSLLLRFTAMLLGKSMVNVGDLAPHVSPPLDDLAAASAQLEKDMRKQITRIGVVALNASGPTTGGIGSVQSLDSIPNSAAASPRVDSLLQGTIMNGPSQTAANGIFRNTDVEACISGTENMWVSIVAALAELGDWPIFFRLAQLLEGGGVNLAMHPPIASALLAAVHTAVDAVYSGLPVAMLTRAQPGRAATPADAAHMLAEQLPSLMMLGPVLAQDLTVFGKVVRILHFLQTEMTSASDPDAHESKLRDVLEFCILPGTAALGSNVPILMEIWELLKSIDWIERYAMYTNLLDVAYAQHPLLAARFAEANHAARQVLKRVTKDNAKLVGRQLAKIAHANPIPVASALLAQVEHYDNLTPLVIDSLRFLHPLALELFAFTFLDTLRYRSQSTAGGNTKWILSFAHFGGSFFKKYFTVELTPMLHYIVQRLVQRSIYDLLVFRELISRMGGFEPIGDISDAQAEAQAGGPVLRAQSALTARPTAGSAKRASEQLMKVLKSWEVPEEAGAGAEAEASETSISAAAARPGHMVVALYVLIAQQREVSLYGAQGTKVDVMALSNDADAVQSCMQQYTSFIHHHLDAVELARMVPPLQELVHSFHLSLADALNLVRPIIAFASDAGAERTDLSMWRRGSPELQAALLACFPAGIESLMSIDSLEAFWTHSMYDLQVPDKQYDTTMQQIRAKVDDVGRRGDSATASKIAKEQKKLTDIIDSLKKELVTQRSHVKHVRQGLEASAPEWLKAAKGNVDTVRSFLQCCVQPRLHISAEDALYCAEFAALMHHCSVKGWSSLQYYDKVVKELTATILCSTESETIHYGLFMKETLNLLNHWVSDVATYDRECKSKPGFSAKRSPSDSRVQYSDFVRVHFLWSQRLLRTLAQRLHPDAPFAAMKNAFSLLRRVISVFPMYKHSGTLQAALSVLQAAPSLRSELKTLTQTYSAMLSRAQLKDDPTSDSGTRSRVDVTPAKPQSATSSAKSRTEIPTSSSKRDRSGTERNGGEDGQVAEPPRSASPTSVRSTRSNRSSSRREARREGSKERKDASDGSRDRRDRSKDRREGRERRSSSRSRKRSEPREHAKEQEVIRDSQEKHSHREADAPKNRMDAPKDVKGRGHSRRRHKRDEAAPARDDADRTKRDREEAQAGPPGRVVVGTAPGSTSERRERIRDHARGSGRGRHSGSSSQAGSVGDSKRRKAGGNEHPRR